MILTLESLEIFTKYLEDILSRDQILTESLALDPKTSRAIFHAFALTLKWVYRIPQDGRAIFELKGEFS